MVNNLNTVIDTVNTVKETVDKVKQTADTVKETVDTVIDTVNTVKDLSKGWKKKSLVATDISAISTQVVEKLSNTPGITQCRGSHFKSATPKFKLRDGTILKTYRNSVGVDHVFLADSSGRMVFGGYVGWIHSENLEATIAEIKKMFV